MTVPKPDFSLRDSTPVIPTTEASKVGNGKTATITVKINTAREPREEGRP